VHADGAPSLFLTKTKTFTLLRILHRRFECGAAARRVDRPEETRFISPSFTGNFFGSVDLNALTPDSSPAFGLQAEHPTGAEYARYLNDVCKHHELDVRCAPSPPVRTRTDQSPSHLSLSLHFPFATTASARNSTVRAAFTERTA